MKINKIIETIEELYPPNIQEDWDNSGWQIKLQNNETQNILLALSPSTNLIKQAIEHNCKLIITHHPLFFGNIRSLNIKNQEENIAIELIQNDIQLYTAHTNLDKAPNGTNDTLAKLLELKNTKTVENFVKIGEIEPISIEKFIILIKNLLNIDKIKITNPTNQKTIQKIGLCTGSGGEFVNKIQDIDVFLTGDIKYHTAISSNTCLFDIGHFESEKIILPILKKIIGENAIIAQETPPWIFA